MLRLVKFLMLALASAGFLWLGINIPAHFRSVSPLVLEAAGEGSRQVSDLAQRHWEGGRLGPARLLWQSLPDLQPSERTRQAIEDQLAEHPNLIYTGGPAPFWERFVEAAPRLRSETPRVAEALLAAENRDHLLRFVGQSTNRTVQTYLQTRNLTGWQLFLPVFSAAGQPLDASILTTAMLEQSRAFGDNISEELHLLAQRALEEDPRALMQLEAVYAAVLTLARRSDWNQLTAWISLAADKEDLLRIGMWVQNDEEQFALLFAALSLVGDPKAILDYLDRHGEEGLAGIRTALPLGVGAMQTLQRFEQPLYQRPAFLAVLPSWVFAGEATFKGFAEAMPYVALFTRGLALAMAGFCFFAMFTVRGSGRAVRDLRKRRLVRLDHAIGGILVALLLGILLEPNLLRFEPNREGSLELNIASVNPFTNNNETSTTQDSTMDQVTILILIFFFVVQMMVFVFALLKMQEIRKQTLPTELKLRLLENEENLFDLGLYVGLFGTVSALILVVLNVVEASLMAAYASTLFGIIFVAVLKVVFLRPLRERLILETESL